MQGVRGVALNLGKVCSVVGADFLGLLTLQMFRESGVRVCMLYLYEKRLAIVRELGVELTLNPKREK